MDAVSALRHEFPALALVTGFAARADRPFLADMLLLWLEYRRASLGAENLIAAARLTWWRDTFTSKKTENVPLAERIIAWSETRVDLPGLVEATDRIIANVLDGENNTLLHGEFALLLEKGLGLNDESLATQEVLASFAKAMDGGQAELTIIPDYIPLALMAWLCERPSRLAYPQQHPMLAFQMLMRALLR